MRIRERVRRQETKPYKVTCLEGDYSASFATKEEARNAKNKHQDRYDDHDVRVSKTVFIYE